MKKVIVISLGGSLIVPDEIDIKFLTKFKDLIHKYKNYKYVIVTGGGSIARKYIHALQETHKSEYLQSLSGISVTRMNARFLSYFFNLDQEGIPHDMKHVENLLQKNDIVFCGALRYSEHQTSDTTCAKLANFLKTDFINLTVVSGLYTKNPLEHKDAVFIPKISWKDFEKKALKIPFKPGQHFVLDQKAATLIKKYKITTYIFGKDLKDFENYLAEKNFGGTVISN